jgi:hypothetical protein
VYLSCKRFCVVVPVFNVVLTARITNHDAQQDANDKNNPLFEFNVDLDVSMARNHLMTRVLKVGGKKHSTGRRMRSDEDVYRVRMRARERDLRRKRRVTHAANECPHNSSEVPIRVIKRLDRCLRHTCAQILNVFTGNNNNPHL